MPIVRNVRMTKLRDNKFWRSAHPNKLGVRTEGPYIIARFHVNGYLNILLHENYWAHQRTQRSVVSLNIPRTTVKTILSMDCIWGVHFLPLILFLHLTFKLVVGWVFFIHFLFVHLWQSKSHHGGKECRAHGNNFLNNGGNLFVLYEFIDYMNSYSTWSHTYEFTLDEFI